MQPKKTFTTDEVLRIAKLANTPIPQSQIEEAKKGFVSIVDLVNKIQSLDTKDIQETNQVTGLENIMRNDEVEPSLTQDEALSNAKRQHNGFFVVDAVFE
jgi:aspartyl-tRNA(Asn)/glutamyl-tRNA(Gln) amidotransferase subunit C